MPPEAGAVRSYVCYSNRFVLSLWSRGKRTEDDSWTMYDRLTGARVKCWSRQEAISTVVRVVTYTRNPEERFVVLPRVPTAYDRNDAVLYDRNTGRWWHRTMDHRLHEDIWLMKELAEMLPENYNAPSFHEHGPL